QRRQGGGRVDLACRVVGGVDDDGPCPPGDGRGDGFEVEVVRLAVDGHADGCRSVRDDYRLVEEPWRGQVDDLVAWVGKRGDRHRQRREAAVGHEDVLWRELAAPQRPQG